MTETEKKIADSFKEKYLAELKGLGCIDVGLVKDLIQNSSIRFGKDKNSDILGQNLGGEVWNRFISMFPKGEYVSLSNHELTHNLTDIEGLTCLLQSKLDNANGRKWCRVGYRPWYRRQAKEYESIIKLIGEKDFWNQVIANPRNDSAIGELFNSRQNTISWHDFREVSEHLFDEQCGLFPSKLNRQIISGLKYIARNPHLESNKPNRRLVQIQKLFTETAERIRKTQKEVRIKERDGTITIAVESGGRHSILLTHSSIFRHSANQSLSIGNPPPMRGEWHA